VGEVNNIYMNIDELNKEIKNCRKCRLCETATQAVPGEGSPKAEIFFVGEGPGFNEDKEGRPFCGAAGKFLDEMLKENGFSRDDVFIGNIVKHRPPGNRDPLPDEVEACIPWLNSQIEAIKPKIIVTLGRHSMHYFLPNVESISKVHGKAFKKDGKLFLTLYHPAAGLHQGNLKETIRADFKNIKKLMKIVKQNSKS
jgi:DNA polymerase